jgi:ribosomal protein S16
MTQPPDLVAKYCDLVVVDGAMPDDERLVALIGAMSPDECVRAEVELAVAMFADFAVSGARLDDPRMVQLMEGMSAETVEKFRERIGLELLRREPIPPRPN